MKAIVFDVDDTLYDLRKPFYQAFADLIENEHPNLPVDEIFKLTRKYSDDIYHNYTSGKWTLDQTGSYRICKAMADFGVELSEEEGVTFQRRYLHYQQHIELTDGMRAVLDYLKGKVTLGILTNGVSEHQHRKLRVLGLSQWIPEEYQLVSGDTGVHKPDPRVFHILEEKMGLAPEEMLYIGDAYVNDMKGAKSAEWNTLWLNRRNHPLPEDDEVVDFMVYTEEELLEELKRREAEFSILDIRRC